MKKRSIEIFRKNGGQLRMSDSIAHGLTRYMKMAADDLTIDRFPYAAVDFTFITGSPNPAQFFLVTFSLS